MTRSLIAAFLVAFTVIVTLGVVAFDRHRRSDVRETELARLRAEEDAASAFIYRVTDAENRVGVHDNAFAEAMSDAVESSYARDRLATTDRAAISRHTADERMYRMRMRAEAAASATAMKRLVAIVSARYGDVATETLRADAARATSARAAAADAPNPSVPDARTASPMRAYLEAVSTADEDAASLERRVDHDVVALHERMERDYRTRQKAYSDALTRENG